MFLDEKKTGEAKTDTFLSAERLGVSEVERAALVHVFRMLENGEFVQSSRCDFVNYRNNKPAKRFFNMGTWHSTIWHRLDPDLVCPRNECGTMGCLGGWTEAFLGKKLDRNSSNKFYDLFYPEELKNGENDLTIARAIKAMRAKLTTGYADWSE